MSAYLLGFGFRADMETPQRKLVLLKMIDACEEDGTRIFPAIATMARAAQCSTRQVQREVAAFVKYRLIRLVREGGKGPRSTNEYALDLDVLQRLAEIGWKAYLAELEADGGQQANATADSNQTGGEEGAHGSIDRDRAAEKGDRESPFLDGEKGDSGDTSRVTGETDKGDSRSRTTPPEPSSDPSLGARARDAEARESDSGSKEEDDPKRIEAAFWRFAPRWPSWVADSKANALKAWNALSPAERELAETRAEEYRAAEKAAAPGRTMRCALSTYLAEKRWERLPPPVARPEAPPLAAPLGKQWMAQRLAELARQDAAGRAHWRMTSFQRAMAEQPDKAHLLVRDRHRGEFPTVARMDEHAEQGRGWPVAGAALPDGHFVQVAVGSEGFAAWGRWHAARDWPWIDPPPAWAEFVWMPSPLPPEGAPGGAEDPIEAAEALG